MRVAIFLACALLALCRSPATAQAENPDPRGAVMCMWMIHSTLSQVADKCRPNADHQFRNALRSGVKRMEDFIIRNSDTTLEQIDQQKKLRAERSVAHRCDSSNEAFREFERLRDTISISDLEKEIDRLIEVDRPPVWNPCL